ncbi:MAG TPA: TetR/AcrR family transcriptional regulator [Dehalococcoidia bacterium]|nr:TetR/AcrR family transcriptional regulator [Dehalococcoidia bacterium]
MSGPSGLRGHRIQNVEKAEGRRREILVAAAAVFARDGYASASLDDVAAKIGVTKGVIYYYFRSKEEIFTEIRATAIRDAIERLEAIIAAGGAAEPMLRAAIRDLVDHIFDDLDRYANILNAQRLSPESHATIRGLQRHYERLIREIVVEGIRTGAFADRDPRVTAFTLLRACLGTAGWYAADGPLSADLVATQVTEQVVSGVLRREG